MKNEIGPKLIYNNKEMQEEIGSLYKQGLSYRQIGKKLGIHFSSIPTYLKKLGIAKRPMGFHYRRKVKDETPMKIMIKEILNRVKKIEETIDNKSKL